MQKNIEIDQCFTKLFKKLKWHVFYGPRCSLYYIVLRIVHSSTRCNQDWARELLFIVDLVDIMKRLLTKYDNLFQVSFPYSMGWHGRSSMLFLWHTSLTETIDPISTICHKQFII